MRFLILPVLTAATIVLWARAPLATANVEGNPNRLLIQKRQDATISTSSETTTNTSPSATDTSISTSSTTSAATGKSTPTPFKLINTDGSATTVTPFITTESNGATSTVNAAPSEGTVVGINDGGSSSDNGSEQNVYVDCTPEKYETINGETPFAPFCLPHNNSVWFVQPHEDKSYYVTWNRKAFSSNATLTLTLAYNKHPSVGIVPKGLVLNTAGFYPITPSLSWFETNFLTPGSIHNISMTFFISSMADDGAPRQGPTIIVATIPPPLPPQPSDSPPITKLGLAVGLPLMLLFILVMVCGTHFCLRARRRIGPIAIGRSGYGVRRSKRQRMRGDIVGHNVSEGPGGYRDEPSLSGNRASSGWELTSVHGEPGAGEYRDASALTMERGGYREDIGEIVGQRDGGGAGRV